MLKKLKEKILGEKPKKAEKIVEKTTTADTDEDQDVTTLEKKPSTKEKKISTEKNAEGEAEIEAKSKKETIMSKYFEGSLSLPNVSDIVEGPVIGIEKGAVYINLHPYGTGIIYGREYLSARDIIKKINIGDNIAAKVVDTNNNEGYIELSLKEARQALIWSEAEDAIKHKKILELPIIEANKGGLLIEWQGITGFLPASQLKTEHYPRVADGDKDRILEELKKLVGQRIAVSIISALPKEGKLIFSEKNPVEKDKEKIIGHYTVGDEVSGTVTGIVDFGVFVKIEDGLEGLVHISEIDWSLVEDPRLLFKVGDKIKVKIIEIKESKISLSAKALKENPWVAAAKKYQKDNLVEGVIIKYNKHGALASVEEGIAGLVHISEFGTEAKLREKLELGKTYHFKITLFDPKDQKMALSFVDKEKKK
ncbi:MAG: S1 RNA-binding domain-containing protein [Candidatus Taylorbacteria bacterium]|nr:S1 RNA-binding domain-containing protein [Candidatus Taylorbacteria bacterium]